MRLHPARPQPARQPEAVPTSFEGQCNPRDLAAGLDRLVTPAMQQAKQPFCTRLQLLAWLALNAGKLPATSQLDWFISTTAMIVLSWSRETQRSSERLTLTRPGLFYFDLFQRAVALEVSFFEAAYTDRT